MKKPRANIILNDEMLTAFPLRSEQGKDAYYHYFHGMPWCSVKGKKKIKSIRIRKKEVKLS